MGMTGAAIRAGQAFVEILADDSKAVKALRGFQARFQSWATTMNNLGRSMMLPALGLGLGLASAAKSFAAFDKEMARVKARLNATDTGFESLKKRALELGKTTAFSAKEAASAMAELAQAGNDSANILLKIGHVIDFAAAAEISLADASIFATTALNTFGLEAEQMGHMLDIIVKGANSSETSVTEMSDAFSYAAPSFKQVGASVQDLSAALMLLAHEGQRGERAGTALRGIFTALLDPSERGADVLRRMVGNIVDARGEFVGLDVVIERMSKSLAGVGGGAKLSALSKIFDNRMVTAITTLVTAGPEKFRQARKEVDESMGQTARMAQIQLQNLSNQFMKLVNTFDTFKFSVVEAVIVPLGNMIEATRLTITLMDDWVKRNPGLTQTIVALGAAFVIAAPTLIAFSVALKLAAFAFEPVLLVISGMRFGVMALLPVLKLLNKALLFTGIKTLAVNAISLITGALAGLGGAIGATITFLVSNPISLLALALVGIAGTIIYMSGVWSKAVSGMGSLWKNMTSDAKATFEALSAAVAAGRMDLAFKIVSIGIELAWLNTIDYLKSTWEEFAFFFEDTWDTATTNAAIGMARLADKFAEFFGSKKQKKVFGGHPGFVPPAAPAGQAPGAGQFSVPPEALPVWLQRKSINRQRQDREMQIGLGQQQFVKARGAQEKAHHQRMMRGQEALEENFQERVKIFQEEKADRVANLEKRRQNREAVKNWNPLDDMERGRDAAQAEEKRKYKARIGKIEDKGFERTDRVRLMQEKMAENRRAESDRRAKIRQRVQSGAGLLSGEILGGEATSDEVSIPSVVLGRAESVSKIKEFRARQAAKWAELHAKRGRKRTSVAAAAEGAVQSDMVAEGATGPAAAGDGMISGDLTDATMADLVSEDLKTRQRAREARKAKLKADREAKRKEKLKSLDEMRAEAQGLLSGADGKKVSAGGPAGAIAALLASGKSSVQGTFSGFAASGFGAGNNSLATIAANTSTTNGLLKKIKDKDGPQFT